MNRRRASLLVLVLLASVVGAAEEGAWLRWTPKGGAGRVDWLLVTSADLVPAFAPLVRHRRDLGLAAEVVTIEEIERDRLLGGGDLPERLRNFVRLLHQEWGLKFLVLGGDSNVVPPRMVPLGLSGPKIHHGQLFAGESYFGCLDGEWNADADASFGEAAPGQDDRPDLAHEVHVGRIPAETTREVEAWVAKLLLYERPRHLDYQDRVAYLGGKVFVEGDADRHYRGLQEKLFGPRGFAPSYFTMEGGVAEVAKTLTGGVGIVCHYHHSFTYNLSLPKGSIDTGNYESLGNAERPTVFFSNGCYSNQFTKEGISEKLLLSPAGGAVAFIGSTNTCFSSSLGLETRFWRNVFGNDAPPIGEALSRMREKTGAMASLGFLRLSMNLLGDPAMPIHLGKPARPEFSVAAKAGAVRVTLAAPAKGEVRVACVQEGAFGAWRDPVAIPAGKREVVFPPVIGNGSKLRVTVAGAGVVPVTKEIDDPVKVRLASLRAGATHVVAGLTGGETPSVSIPLPEDLAPGPLVLERDLDGAKLRVVIPVLPGADVGFVQDGKKVLFPGFARMGAPRPDGIPLLAAGSAEVVEITEGQGLGAAPDVEVERTESRIRLGWEGVPGARWLVLRLGGEQPEVLTPVPLVNPVFELTGLAPLSEHRFAVERLGGTGRREITASTTFPFQSGFPQQIGANVTSVQLLDLDGRGRPEVLFGDDAKGLWALHDDGREVRHAGDNWTFGLFAAIESGVFEPVVANIVGSRRPEILATSKLNDRKLYAFTRDGKPVKGFPVSFRSRLMTPPLVGDFDGKRGVEILVVAGFGKTVELVRPDGSKEPYATIGQYNYGYPIAANLDRDKPLELLLLDGAGKVHALDQGGVPMKGFPIDLGGPGRATPILADLDGDRKPEIVAVGKGTTRLAVIDPRKGKVLVDLVVPDAGKPSNYSLFYPGVANLGGKKTLSIVLGTPSKKLFAFDLVDRKELRVREGFPIDLPAEARGVAAADVTGDGRDELFLSLHNGEVWGLTPEGAKLAGFPLVTKADTYGVPLLEDLDGDRDLELFLGAADGILRVWDLPYRKPKKAPTWPGLLGGSGMPGSPPKR
ncbi:MAG: C25 family cysteine peptidase [Planctomycetota bacterium]